jgi:hypothetical protein
LAALAAALFASNWASKRSLGLTFGSWAFSKFSSAFLLYACAIDERTKKNEEWEWNIILFFSLIYFSTTRSSHYRRTLKKKERSEEGIKERKDENSGRCAIISFILKYRRKRKKEFCRQLASLLARGKRKKVIE